MSIRDALPWDRSRLPAFVPAALVAVIALVGLGLVLTQHWRRGAVLLGVALLVAAALRVAVPAERVGLLAIRGKAVDVLVLLRVRRGDGAAGGHDHPRLAHA